MVIVTRQRRKPFPWKRLILPAIALVLVVVAFAWTPSRNVIANGPAAPMVRTAAPVIGNIAAPFHFAAQNQVIADRNREISTLQSQVAEMQSKAQAKDKQISTLQSQVSDLQTQAASSHSNAQPTAAPAGSATAASSASAPGTGDAAQASDVAAQRTAQYWANMEPENAAKVIQKLPVPYVSRVLAKMAPDAAGAILDALPSAYAAQLTQEHPELKQ